jgi:hypothetical protein
MLKCVGGNSCFPAIAFWPELWLADGERARIAGWRRTLCAGAGTTCVLVILSSPLDVVRRSLPAGLRRSDIGEILVCAFHLKRLSLLTLARRANSTRRTWAPSPSKSQQAMMCVQMLSRASRSVWKREKLCSWKKSNTHALHSLTFGALDVPALMAAATQDSAAWCKPYHHLAGRLHRGAPERGTRISGAFGCAPLLFVTARSLSVQTLIAGTKIAEISFVSLDAQDKKVISAAIATQIRA